MAPCSRLRVKGCFGGTRRFHHQSRRICLSSACCLFQANLCLGLFFDTENWELMMMMIIIIIISGARPSPLGTAATISLLYQPRMIDDGDCGAIGGMRTGRENRSIRRKPAPVPLCQRQILHDLTRARIRAAAVGNQRLTAWAMVRPWDCAFLRIACWLLEDYTEARTLHNFRCQNLLPSYEQLNS
jgi:hypothetical protein